MAYRDGAVCDNLPCMFETTQFLNQLNEVIGRETDRTSLTHYESNIAVYLQSLAVRNEPILMERELKKAASDRRGVSAALVSVSQVVQEASRYAVLDRQTTLRLSDVQKACEAKFCQIWPFCR